MILSFFFHACPTRTNQSSDVRLINCSRDLVVGWKLFTCVSRLVYCIWGSAIICNRRYIKKINRLYDICVNLCMGPLKWVVSFQWVLYPWHWEKFRHRLGYSELFSANKVCFKLLLIRNHFFGVEFFLFKANFWKLVFFINIFSKSHNFY